jgi:FKBP-type peptidyl-prolyl cis-trans isomerase
MSSKNSIYSFFILALCALTACNGTDENTSQWRLDNQAAYDGIKMQEEWQSLDIDNGPSGVYYKDITISGTEIGNEYPLQTASVEVNYTGKYYNGTIFDSGKKSTFPVNNVVRGFSAALQSMRTGQKWEVCIPHYLGYGAAGTTSIQGYTTLFFDIELLKINQYPK